MQKKTKSILLILTSVILVDIGQLVLKKGLIDLAPLDFSTNLIATFITILTNPFVFLGILFFVSSSFTWLLALSKSNLSFAYPLLSIGYVIVSLLSWHFFDENLSPLRLLGIGIIVGGVYFMSKT